MTNVTLAVPKELHAEMRRHPEIRWSEVARMAFQNEVDRLHVLDRLFEASRLTERDAADLGKSIRRAAARRHR